MMKKQMAQVADKKVKEHVAKMHKGAKGYKDGGMIKGYKNGGLVKAPNSPCGTQGPGVRSHQDYKK